MSTFEYPSTLPGPQPGQLTPRVRRAVSSIDGPLQQRTRQRDAAGLHSQYTFVYTPSEMAAWRTWYDEVLGQGRCWCAMRLPGRGGLVQRTVRYLSVEHSLLGGGIYRVVAQFEQRGASLLPSRLPSRRTWQVDLNARVHAGANSAVGVLLSGLYPDRQYVLTQPAGGVYTAYSYFATDGEAVVPGQIWANGLVATGGPGASAPYTDPRSLIVGSGAEDPQWATASAARAAFGSHVITGYTEFRLWIYDSLVPDNRGGLSLYIEEQ